MRPAHACSPSRLRHEQQVHHLRGSAACWRRRSGSSACAVVAMAECLHTWEALRVAAFAALAHDSPAVAPPNTSATHETGVARNSMPTDLRR